jgi:outer membrane protein
MNVRSLSRLALLAAICLPSLAAAQSFATVRLGPPGIDARRAGLAVVSAPRYLGSDERRTLAMPLLDAHWANGWFAGTVNGIGYNFSKQATRQYGLRLTADFGRPERRSAALRGLGDVDARPELGGFLNIRPTSHLLLSSSLRAGSGRERKGLVLDLGATQALALGAQWHASIGLGLTLANRAHLQDYFGVNAAQASASGLSVHAPDSGLRDVRATLGLSYRVAPATALSAGLTVQALQGDARTSPVTRDRRAVSGMLALTHSF